MILKGKNCVLPIKRFNFLFPLIYIKTLVVIECDFLGIHIDTNVFNSRKLAAYIFDERGTGSAVDTGNRNGSLHKIERKELTTREADNIEYFIDECFLIQWRGQLLCGAGMQMAFEHS